MMKIRATLRRVIIGISIMFVIKSLDMFYIAQTISVTSVRGALRPRAK